MRFAEAHAPEQDGGAQEAEGIEDENRVASEEHGDQPPEELRERILREIQAFVGDAPQHDDMTMVVVKVIAS